MVHTCSQNGEWLLLAYLSLILAQMPDVERREILAHQALVVMKRLEGDLQAHTEHTHTDCSRYPAHTHFRAGAISAAAQL